MFGEKKDTNKCPKLGCEGDLIPSKDTYIISGVEYQEKNCNKNCGGKRVRVINGFLENKKL